MTFDLLALGFQKANMNYPHIYFDSYGLRYNIHKDKWFVRGALGYTVEFFPESVDDIETVRRLFSKKHIGVVPFAQSVKNLEKNLLVGLQKSDTNVNHVEKSGKK